MLDLTLYLTHLTLTRPPLTHTHSAVTRVTLNNLTLTAVTRAHVLQAALIHLDTLNHVTLLTRRPSRHGYHFLVLVTIVATLQTSPHNALTLLIVITTKERAILGEIVKNTLTVLDTHSTFSDKDEITRGLAPDQEVREHISKYTQTYFSRTYLTPQCKERTW